MPRLILLSLIFCAACSHEGPAERILVDAPIPAELLTPVADPAPAAPQTQKELASGYVRRGAALLEANSKICAIAEIKAEGGRDPACANPR